MSRLPPMDGLTESSIEDFIISTIVAPFDSIMSKDLERSATPTSFSVRDWASDIEISGIFILITSIFLILQVYHISDIIGKTVNRGTR